jgi:hypothetical protein
LLVKGISSFCLLRKVTASFILTMSSCASNHPSYGNYIR